MTHKRKKHCVLCSATWVIEYEDNEGFTEHVVCQTCRAERQRMDKLPQTVSKNTKELEE